jgi:hypothetical protein
LEARKAPGFQTGSGQTGLEVDELNCGDEAKRGLPLGRLRHGRRATRPEARGGHLGFTREAWNP